MSMAIQVKPYANKAGKAEGVQNRVQVSMSTDEAKALASRDKELLAEFLKNLKDTVGSE
jgi:hypothetical protein